MLWPKGRELNSRELFKESSRSGGKVGDGDPTDGTAGGGKLG